MATTLYVGGLVRPCDGATASAEALVERDGRVVGVGGRQDMERIAGANAERIDVRGATILPGLVDTHPHVLHFGVFSYPLVDLSDARSHEDIVPRVRARAATTAPGEWIMATPVGEPHYFVRRSWQGSRRGASARPWRSRSCHDASIRSSSRRGPRCSRTSAR